MKRWAVSLPVSGYVSVTVNAETEDAAITAALNEDFRSEDIIDWEVHRYLVKGNVCYASPTEAWAEIEESGVEPDN
jgi:hypothetical protein